MRPSLHAKKAESDLVKAYETIYKKSRDPQMKSMARKYLESCGYFNNENREIKKQKKAEPAQIQKQKQTKQ